MKLKLTCIWSNKRHTVKYLSPDSLLLKFWVTTFWFMKVLCSTGTSPKMVTQNFYIELTGDKYFKHFMKSSLQCLKISQNFTVRILQSLTSNHFKAEAYYRKLLPEVVVVDFNSAAEGSPGLEFFPGVLHSRDCVGLWTQQ